MSLAKERGNLEGASTLEIAFDPGLLVTNNAAQVAKERIDLTGPYRKKPWPLLVVCDEGANGTKTWKTILCSIKDGINFKDLLSGKDAQMPQGRTMWLARGNGKKMSGPSKLDIDSNPQLALQMTQALFFAGAFDVLSYKPWKQRLAAWLDPLPEQQREKITRYFENEILMGHPPGYTVSPLHKYLHKTPPAA